MNFLACDLGGTKVLIGIYEYDFYNKSPKLITKKNISPQNGILLIQ